MGFIHLYVGGKFAFHYTHDLGVSLLFAFRNNFYVDAALKGLKPAIIGLIAAAALLLLNQRNFIDYKSWIIFALVFGASIKKTDPILLIVLAGIAGYFLY